MKKLVALAMAAVMSMAVIGCGSDKPADASKPAESA